MGGDCCWNGGVWKDVVLKRKLGFPSVLRFIEHGGGMIKMGKEDLKVSCVKEVMGKEEVWLE